MKQRVISGAVLVVILAITLYFGGIVTCGLMALVSLVGNMELLRVYGVNKKTPGIVCYLATVLYYIAIYLDRMDIIVPMMVVYLLVMLAVYVLTFPTYSDKQIMAALQTAGNFSSFHKDRVKNITPAEAINATTAGRRPFKTPLIAPISPPPAPMAAPFPVLLILAQPPRKAPEKIILPLKRKVTKKFLVFISF